MPKLYFHSLTSDRTYKYILSHTYKHTHECFFLSSEHPGVRFSCHSDLITIKYTFLYNKKIKNFII